MLIKTREVVEHEVQRRVVLATGGSGINSRGRMLPPGVLSSLRQGKFLGSEQKYSVKSQKYSVTRFDHGPYLFVPTSVITPPHLHRRVHHLRHGARSVFSQCGRCRGIRGPLGIHGSSGHSGR